MESVSESVEAEAEPKPKTGLELTQFKIHQPSVFSCKQPPFCGNFDPAAHPRQMTDIIEFIGEGAFNHEPNTVVRLRVDVTTPLVVGFETRTAEGTTEVYRRQQLLTGENEILWLLEERIGKSPNPSQLFFSLGGNTESEFSNLSVELVNGDSLSNEELLQATQFQPIQLAYKQPNLQATQTQTVQVVLPRELHRRFPGQSIVVQLGDETQEFIIDPTAPIKQEFFIHEFTLQLSELPLEKHLVQAALKDESGNILMPLGAETFTLVDSLETNAGYFEVPYRNVVDYTPFFQNTDLRLIILPEDQLSKGEPIGFETLRHEVLDYTISTKTLLSREHIGWRTPGFGHFAEAGFQQLSTGSTPLSKFFFLSARNAEERDVLGFGVSVDNGPFGAPISNPLYAPSREWTGSMLDADAVRMINSGAEKFGSAFLMLTQFQLNKGPARMLANVSNDLRSWVEVGIVAPLDRRSTPAKHLFLTKHQSFFFLIRDREVWISQDPLRSWSKMEIPLPNWANVRLIESNDQWYFFGIDQINQKNMVRWQPCQWNMNPQGFLIPEIISSQ
ncbi:MAG: hypothetical protein ACFCU1_08655 [Sumerlaeia bacterium]